MAEPLGYINTLELYSLSGQRSSGEKSYAAANNLNMFAAGLSTEDQQAVNNTTLLASKAADHVADKGADPVKWYNKYGEVLGAVGWITESFSFQPFHSSSSEFEMDQVILEYMARNLTPSEVDSVRTSLEAFNKPSAGAAWQIFEQSATKDRLKGCFQMAVCQEDRGGDLVMGLSAYSFQSAQAEARFLWATYKTSNTKLTLARQTMTLNRSIYNRAKDAIIAKLAHLIQDDIISIPV